MVYWFIVDYIIEHNSIAYLFHKNKLNIMNIEVFELQIIYIIGK